MLPASRTRREPVSTFSIDVDTGSYANVRRMLESGVLRQSSEGDFQLSGPLPDTIVPDSLQDLLMARLDRMPIEGRKVLQLGSCIGRDWSFELLNAIFPEEESILLTGIDQLLEKGIIHSTGDGFTIKHALIQDASYESLLRSTRHHFHERIALALQRGQGPGQAFPERIAQHWTKAERPDQALPFWLEAGQRAVTSSAMAEAENHLRHGLEAIAELPDSPERDQFELALLSTLGVALTLQNGWAAPALVEVYDRAQLLSERIGPNPTVFWVVWGMWAFYLVKGDQHRSLALARQLTGIAEAERNPSLTIEADFALGLSLLLRGQIAAALPLLESACERYVPEKHHSHAYMTGQDVGVTARTASALALYLSKADPLLVQAERHGLQLRP